MSSHLGNRDLIVPLISMLITVIVFMELSFPPGAESATSLNFSTPWVFLKNVSTRKKYTTKIFRLCQSMFIIW